MDRPDSSCFLLRVYALLFTTHNHIVLSREIYQGQELVKFPGGGVEYGEGLREALSREIREELAFETDPLAWKHFYTTDFFQPSAFHERRQVISVYYRWPELLDHQWWANRLKEMTSIPNRKEEFFLLCSTELTPEVLSLPIDRHVALLLRECPR